MNRIQLVHPEGKKAPTMEISKYEALQSAIVHCMDVRGNIDFKTLAGEVITFIEKNAISFKGNIEWNLFLVMSDMESNGLLVKDRTTSPVRYALKKHIGDSPGSSERSA